MHDQWWFVKENVTLTIIYCPRHLADISILLCDWNVSKYIQNLSQILVLFPFLSRFCGKPTNQVGITSQRCLIIFHNYFAPPPLLTLPLSPSHWKTCCIDLFVCILWRRKWYRKTNISVWNYLSSWFELASGTAAPSSHKKKRVSSLASASVRGSRRIKELQAERFGSKLVSSSSEGGSSSAEARGLEEGWI